jgi:hypothetical protein
MAASIEFITAKGTYSFSDEGTAQWGQRNDYDAQGEGPPQIRRTTYTIVQTFNERSYADNEARIQRLRAVLDAAEGKLVIRDENGGPVVTAQVRVRSDDVPREWRQYKAEVTVVLEQRRLLESATALPATFTPTGGAPVSLPNVADWKVAIRTTRFSNQASNRDETIETVTASGFILVDKALAPAERLKFLQKRQEEFRRCDAKEGVLKWGGDSLTVRVESLDVTLGDGQDRATWSLVAFRKTFPNGSYAQPEYSVTNRWDYSTGHLVTSVRGTVKADREEEAKSAIAALKQSHSGAGRILENEETSDARLGGVDGAAWLEVSFSYEYRETIREFIGYQLRVSTRDEAESADKRVTYEGSVAGESVAAALAIAREVGANKLPGMVSSEEVVSTKKNSLSSDETFVEVTFAYEYLGKSGTLRYAEVTREIVRPAFGEAREVISGFAAAETLNAAMTMMNSLRLSGRVQRDETTRSGERKIGEAAGQVLRLEFSFEYYLTPVRVSLAYGVETTNDLAALEKTVVLSGVARGPSEAACRAAIEALSNQTRAGMTRLVHTRRPEFEKQGSDTEMLVSVAFTDRFAGVADDLDGVDIVDASYSVRTQYSVNKVSMTLIPGGHPYRQTGLGWIPGLRTVSGSVTARREATARNWGRARRGLLTGGDIDQLEDDLQMRFLPLSGEMIKSYTYAFTFAARYAHLPML